MKIDAIAFVKSRCALLLLSSVCAILAGCSSSPSSGDGERAIQDRIKDQSEGRIKLARFEKTNGAQGELMGLKFYALEFEAETEFTEDCKWLNGVSGQPLSFRTSIPIVQPQSGFSWKAFADDTQNPGTLVKKGQRAMLAGTVRFVKKERGWSVDGIELTRVTPSYGQAAQLLRKKAEKGDANAQYQLGKIYADGQGFEKNDAEAFKWFKKSAEQGFAPGQNGLGTRYWSGRGVDKDVVEAVRWYRKAVDQGNPKAQANLGHAYMLGLGVETNAAEAMKWYRNSADQGESYAYVYLGLAYENGDGVEKNATEAVKWYQKSAEAGNSLGQRLLGLHYSPIMGVENNDAEAFKWFKKAAEQGDDISEVFLGDMYEAGRGVPTNHDLAVQWYRKAAEAGDNGAMSRLEAFVPPAVKYERALAEEKARALKKTRVDVINDLRMIDGAKQQWALQKSKAPEAVPSEDDLDPYLGRGTNGLFPVHPPGGRYVINSVGQPPESTAYGKLGSF
jgi:TPR repeat protein